MQLLRIVSDLINSDKFIGLYNIPNVGNNPKETGVSERVIEARWLEGTEIKKRWVHVYSYRLEEVSHEEGIKIEDDAMKKAWYDMTKNLPQSEASNKD